MDRRERIERFRSGLWGRDWISVVSFPAPPGWILRRLLALLQDPSPGFRWRAVLALGQVAQALPTDEASLREFIRSLLWSMNDESGNLCRMAPEALGEVLRVRPDLRQEYAPLLAQYLVEEPFETGTLWALCRLAEAGCRVDIPGVLLATSLAHHDPRRSGLARRLERMRRQA